MRDRARIMLAVWLSLLAVGVPTALANACGQTITVSPRRSLGPGPAPLAVGDSVLYDAAEALSTVGFETNAMVCRTMAQGIVWLQAHDQNLPVLVVVALGTNGSVTSAQIDQLLSLVGPQRILALVTPHNGNYAYVPGLLRAAAARHPGRIELLDWDRLSANHPDWFAPDGIHLGGSAGVDAYAQLVASALAGGPTSGPGAGGQSPGGQSPGGLAAGVQPAPIGAPKTIAPSAGPVPKPTPKPNPGRAAMLALTAVDQLYAAVATGLTL